MGTIDFHSGGYHRCGVTEWITEKVSSLQPSVDAWSRKDHCVLVITPFAYSFTTSLHILVILRPENNVPIINNTNVCFAFYI